MGAAKKAGLAGTIEGMGAVAVADMEAIKAAEDLAAEAQKKLNALQQKAAVIGMESANTAGKGDVLLIMDDIAKLDKVGTALLRDKKEMLAAIGSTEKMVWTHGRLATLLNA